MKPLTVFPLPPTQDGRLRSGDHILQIGDVNVRGMGSEMVASVLRQSGSHVRLIVARGVTEPFPSTLPQAPIVPTHALDESLRHLYAALLAADNQQDLDYANMNQTGAGHMNGGMGMMDVGAAEHYYNNIDKVLTPIDINKIEGVGEHGRTFHVRFEEMKMKGRITCTTPT